VLTDQDIPPQFEAVQDPDENILWIGKSAFVPFLCKGIPFLVFGLFWGAIDYFGFIRNMPSQMSGFAIPFFALHLFPLWAGILNMARLYLVFNNTCYAVTNKRLLMRSGFFGIDFKAIDFDKIVNVEVNVGPIENLFGVGTIQAYSGSASDGKGRIYDRFIAIENPYEVFKQIKQVSVDIKTDWNYPNAMRPAGNPGYNTKYDPKS
jgi:membrane protein YdbS with pleckstrin-like domain